MDQEHAKTQLHHVFGMVVNAQIVMMAILTTKIFVTIGLDAGIAQEMGVYPVLQMSKLAECAQQLLNRFSMMAQQVVLVH